MEIQSPVKCPVCNFLARRTYTNQGAKAKVWDSEKLYENLGDVPLRFKTEGDLRRYCKDRGWSSGAIL